MLAISLLVLSTLLQFAAAALAIRLVQRTRTWQPWWMLAAALLLMGLRHCLLLGRVFTSRTPPDLVSELIDLGVTLLFVSGLLSIRARLERERRSVLESWDRHRQVLDATTAVIYVKDVHGWRYEFVNERFSELFGLSFDDCRDKTDYELFPRELADDFRRNDRRVLESGEVVEITERAPHGDGLHTYISVKFPLRDGDGTITAIAGISTDITPLVNAETEVARLDAQLERVLDSVTEGIYGVDAEGVTTFANRAAAEMLGWDRDELLGQRQHSISHHSHDDGRPYPIEDCRIHAAIHERLHSRVDDEVFWRRDDTCFPVSYSTSPIVDGGECVGAVVTFRDRTEEVEREKLESELKAARVVQDHLYPTSPPELPGFDVAGTAVPASQACGDYFDFIPVAGGNWVLAVGDVCGHGLGAALHMVEARALLRNELAREPDLARAVRRMNVVLERDTPDDTFLVLFLVRVDPELRSLAWIGAGHHAWILRGEDVITLTSSTMLLGLAEQVDVEESPPVPLEPGDLLLLVTDGLYEARRNPRAQYGVPRLLESARRHRDLPAAEIVECIVADVDEFVGASEPTDDRTLIVLKAE